MKASKKTLCILLALIMALAAPMSVFAESGTTEPQAETTATEATSFPASDQPMIENTTDSSKLPTREDVPENAQLAQLSDVYGTIENDKAEVVSSMIDDEAMDEFSRAIDLAAGFEPVSSEDASLVLGKVETFLTSGGLSSYLENGNLLMGSDIGLTRNKTEKVQVLGADTNASSWVFVVDKDAMSWWVKDEDGMGIPNAFVTISWLDESGRRFTKSTPTTAGNTPGIAVFDDIPDAFYGIIDIQAEGYRAVSILDREMGKGYHEEIVLEESPENDLYIRGVDLSGKDMVNEETKLNLMNMDTGDLTLKVLVTKTGSAQFPDTIEIKSDNRGKTVLEISQTSSYDFDSNTKVYTATKRWVEQSAGLLKDADLLSIDIGSESMALEHVTVANAVSTPGSGETEMPLTQKTLNGDTEDRLGGGGWLNQSLQLFMIPVNFGLFPDGTFVLMASYDITRLDPNTQYKFSGLFDKSWNPKAFSNIKNPLEVFQKSFWENTEKVKKGQKILESTKKIKAVCNPNYDYQLSFSLFLGTCYNEATGDSYGNGGILFSGGITAGVTEYFLICAGPVVIPLYIGFEGHLYTNVTLKVNVFLDQAPTGHEKDAAWKYSSDDGWDVNSRIEVITGFSVFGGVGVKGAFGAAAVGYADFDIAAVLGKGQASTFTDPPHSFIDFLYGLKIEYYLLFYSGTIKIDSLNDVIRLDDSNWKKKALTEAAKNELEFTPLDLSACAEDYTPAVAAGDGPKDEYFLLNGSESLEAGELGSGIVDVDVSVIPDSQLQFASTKDYTALFRLGSNGSRVDIYYQLQNPDTGNLYSGLYKVRLPEDETRSVSEFVVVPNKTDGNNNVYIGAVVVDESLTDENERMRSTDVYAMVVDLDREYTTSSVIASDPAKKGQYLYSAPKPAGREDYCSVGYAATYLYDEEGNAVDGLVGLLGATPLYTDYYISWGEEGHPEQRSYKNLGRNKIYSTGVIAPNEPSYWVVDGMKSSDKYLYVKGYGANGFYEETLRCNFRLDIEGMVALEDIKKGVADFDIIMSNWQYMNGCNYFIAGDSVYWMSKSSSDPESYEWVVEKVEDGSGVVSVDNRYAMITNNNNSAVYLIGVVGDYETDFETGASEKGYNIAKIYTISTDKDASGNLSCKLHGPLDIKFANGDEINAFAAAYNPEECAASGLTIAYSTQPNNPQRYKEKIRMWNQNADRGLLVTRVEIPDYLVLSDQPTIELLVTVRNYGYGKENHVPYNIYDENGATLMITDGTHEWTPSSYFFSGDDLYTGDSRVDKILIRPNKDWEKNKEHEITVEVTGGYQYNGSIDDVVNSARMEADNMTLTAENILIGGKHFIHTTIHNNTPVGEKTPIVKIVMDYAPKESSGTQTGKAILLASLGESDVKAGSSDGSDLGRTPGELKFSMPTKEMIVRYGEDDEELTGQVYHFNVDMDSVWDEGLDNGLRGVYVSLVDSDGNQQSNETIYLPNPAEKREIPHGNVKVTLTDADAPEKTLSGATFAIYDEDGNKVGELTEISKGVYEISDLPAGEYTVKLENAPKGYKADGSWKVTISEDGVTIEIDAAAEEEAPPTGDHSQLILYIAIIVVALAAVAALVFIGRRKKESEEPDDTANE